MMNRFLTKKLHSKAVVTKQLVLLIINSGFCLIIEQPVVPIPWLYTLENMTMLACLIDRQPQNVQFRKVLSVQMTFAMKR